MLLYIILLCIPCLTILTCSRETFKAFENKIQHKSAHTVKGLGHIYKGYVEIAILFPVLFQNLFDGKGYLSGTEPQAH